MNGSIWARAMGKPMLVFLMLILGTALPGAMAAEDITGEWEMMLDFNGWESISILSLARNADGTLTGKWDDTELSGVKFENQKLSFVRTNRWRDQEFTSDYKGTLKDGKLIGELSSDMGTLTANGVRPKPKPEILGDWDITIELMDRKIPCRLSVSAKPDGSLMGDWVEEMGEHKISDIEFKEGKITFKRKSKIEEMEFELTYNGVLKDNKLTGTFTGGEWGELQANGTRVGAELVGEWELTTTTDMGPWTRKLIVFGDLSARYQSFFGGYMPIDKLKLEDGNVSFKIERGTGERQFTLEFKAKLEDDMLKGQFTHPRGTDEVTGKKIGAAASPLIGRWELTSETPRGTRTNTLTIKPDMTGTYTFRDREVEVTDLKIDGDQLSFKVTMPFREREFTMDFKGKVEGESLKGTFTTERGEREVTGKKIGAAP